MVGCNRYYVKNSKIIFIPGLGDVILIMSELVINSAITRLGDVVVIIPELVETSFTPALGDVTLGLVQIPVILELGDINRIIPGLVMIFVTPELGGCHSYYVIMMGFVENSVISEWTMNNFTIITVTPLNPAMTGISINSCYIRP